MCGIAGYAGLFGSHTSELSSIMLSGIARRGPDDSGFWADASAGIGLIHSRLAILDLSSAGHQPMTSASGRYVLTFNGEIYNFLLLKRELVQRGHEFRGGSDTEIMLAAFEEWGVISALQRFQGMFAFAVWDAQDRLLTLARDKVGMKPLYYGWQDGAFFFASDLGSIAGVSRGKLAVDSRAVALMLKLGFVPDPMSIYQGFYKLPPGSFLQLSEGMFSGLPSRFTACARRGGDTGVGPVAFWSSLDFDEEGVSNGDPCSTIDRFEGLLLDAVSDHLVADVPVGALLSGGVDSSLLLALARTFTGNAITAFSIGFEEKALNEAGHARAIARYLGVHHEIQYVSSRDLIDLVSDLPRIFSEPFADPSQIPCCLVARMARRGVKVALSGDGGDELFCGYNRYVWGGYFWRHSWMLPESLRRAVGRGMARLPAHAVTHLGDSLGALFGRGTFPSSLGDKVQRIAEVLQCRNQSEVYNIFVDKLPFIRADFSLVYPETGVGVNLIQTMMRMDFAVGLPGDMLTKVDRASMNYGLEVRLPLLDDRVVEAALRLPFEFKLRGQKGKFVLREILKRYIPEQLWNRPKQGFGIPLDRWLRGPLRNWAEERLFSSQLPECVDRKRLEEVWAEHSAGTRNWQYGLWHLISFVQWQTHQAKLEDRSICSAEANASGAVA